jgi:riboflavin synthase
MFTGIIEGSGSISRSQATQTGRRMSIRADFDLDDTRLGDSIAVNGACLTVVTLHQNQFEVDISAESLTKTTLGQYQGGTKVNLERALKLTARLDGHLVSGHIDGMGVVQGLSQTGDTIDMTIKADKSLTRYIIPKGSIAIDGISLTVNTIDEDQFTICLIPHTQKMTTLNYKHVGDSVNIETDMIGKYVERFLRYSNTEESLDVSKDTSTQGKVDINLLAKSGFLS